MTELRDNVGAGRFEMDEAGETAFATYRRAGDRLIINHVEAPPALRGTGASGRLMELLVAKAREENRKITALCSYAAAWLSRRPEYADLLAQS